MNPLEGGRLMRKLVIDYIVVNLSERLIKTGEKVTPQ